MKRSKRQKQIGRKRGGQKGNTNALKHGIYSKYMSMQEELDIEGMPVNRNFNELAMARVRLTWCLEKQANAKPEEWLAYERAIIHYMRIIAFYTSRNHTLILEKHDDSRMEEAFRWYRRVCGLPE